MASNFSLESFGRVLRIAGIAAAFYAAIAPHNPLGPISLAAGLHLAASIPNFLCQEQVSLGVGYIILRQQCATPIATGELFNNPNEWLDLVSGRLIDFIRCHLSQVGGISAARKIAN